MEARDTGFALVYPPEAEGTLLAEKPNANVTLRLYDKHYGQFAERTLEPLAPGGHLARFVHEMFDQPYVKALAQEMEGILVIESDQPIVAVTVRQNDDPEKEFQGSVAVEPQAQCPTKRFWVTRTTKLCLATRSSTKTPSG